MIMISWFLLTFYSKRSRALNDWSFQICTVFMVVTEHSAQDHQKHLCAFIFPGQLGNMWAYQLVWIQTTRRDIRLFLVTIWCCLPVCNQTCTVFYWYIELCGNIYFVASNGLTKTMVNYGIELRPRNWLIVCTV